MPDNSRTRPRWSASTKIVVIVMVLALGVYLLSQFHEVIPPLVLSAILAYVLSPAVRWLERRARLPRVAAVALVYALMLAALVAVPLVLTPVLLPQLRELDFDLRLVTHAIAGLPQQALGLAGPLVDLGPALEQLNGSWRGFMDSFAQRTATLVVEVLTSLVWAVFVLVISFYLVKDGERLARWFERLPPPAFRDDFRRLRDEINLVWAAFFRGQIVLAFVVAVIFTVVGWAIGLPFALALGVLAGLLEFLPSVGHGIWFAVAVTVALLQGSAWLPIPSWAFALVVAGLHIVFQQVDLNFLIPRIIGRRVHLPPLVVILGIVAGAALAGVLGVALAAPTIASARILARYAYANLLDEDPFPSPGATKAALREPVPAALTASTEP